MAESKELEQLEWLKGNYTRVTAQYTRIPITEHEQEAFNQIEEKLKRADKLESYLQKWSKQLKIDGVNSKSMVLNDIQFLIKEGENEKMKLNDFINHIKHNSIIIDIRIIREVYNGYESLMIPNQIYFGDVGSFKHWVNKHDYELMKIHHIEFNNNEMIILLYDEK